MADPSSCETVPRHNDSCAITMNGNEQVTVLGDEHAGKQHGEEDLTIMLDEGYGISLTLSVMKRGKECELQGFECTEGPVQIFSLIIPEDNSHLLFYVANASLT